MLIKIQSSDGGFIVHDKVESVHYSQPNTYLPAPDSVKNYLELEQFIEGIIFGLVSFKSKKDVHIGTTNDDLGDGRKILFIGEVYIEEEHKGAIIAKECLVKDPTKHSFRFISYMRGKIEHWVYTEEPVYICSDDGKTLEVIR